MVVCGGQALDGSELLLRGCESLEVVPVGGCALFVEGERESVERCDLSVLEDSERL